MVAPATLKVLRTGTVLTLLSLSLPALAQVGFVIDVLKTQLCMAANWEQPRTQQWLAGFTAERQAQIESELPFTKEQKHCLAQQTSTPVALCDKTLDIAQGADGLPLAGGGMPFLDPKLSTEESERLDQMLSDLLDACLGDDVQAAAQP